MKITTTLLTILIFVSLSYSQKETLKIEKFSQKVLQNTSKGNIWVMDVMKSYTGQGSSGWDFDYTEIVLARNSRGLPTVIETKEKIEGTANWVNLYHAELSYHANDTIAEYKLNEWNRATNSWLNLYSYYETKDEDGKKLIHYTRSWQEENQIFNQGNKEIYTYDANGVLTTMEDKDWDYTNSTWTNWAMSYFIYDANNNVTQKLYKRYQSGTYNNNWKTEYTYNANNQKITEQEWGYSGGWVDYSKITYTYYDNGLIKEVYTQRYSTKKSGWYDLAKTKYFYNTNNLLDYKEEIDLQNNNNNLKYAYTYNTDNQETTFFLYDWNGSDWTLFYKVFDNYDANGNQTSFYSQSLDGTWKNYLKEEYTWNEFFVNINDLSSSNLTIFPNPTSKVLTIKNGLSEKYYIEIFNISGKLICSNSTSYKTYNINVSNYANGIYFVNILTSKGKKSFNFLKN